MASPAGATSRGAACGTPKASRSAASSSSAAGISRPSRSTARSTRCSGPEYYDAWYRETPPGFLFAVKGSRYITHLLRLKNIEKPLANFFASGIFNLRDKLGPFLWQFPRRCSTIDRERLEAFFELLPRTPQQALALARRRDARMIGPLAARDRRGSPAAPRGRDPPSELHERRFRRAAEEARHRPRGGRHRGQVAEAVRRHRGLRLRAPARRREDLHQRLYRAARSTAGRGASAPGTATGATSTCTSTTT